MSGFDGLVATDGPVRVAADADDEGDETREAGVCAAQPVAKTTTASPSAVRGRPDGAVGMRIGAVCGACE